MEAQETPTVPSVETQSQQQPTAATPVQTPGCTGACKKCTSYQRNYCAAQIGYNMQNVLANLIARMDKMQEQVGRLADEVTLLSKQFEEPPVIIEAPTPSEQPKKTKKPAKS